MLWYNANVMSSWGMQEGRNMQAAVTWEEIVSYWHYWVDFIILCGSLVRVSHQSRGCRITGANPKSPLERQSEKKEGGKWKKVEGKDTGKTRKHSIHPWPPSRLLSERKEKAWIGGEVCVSLFFDVARGTYPGLNVIDTGTTWTGPRAPGDWNHDGG